MRQSTRLLRSAADATRFTATHPHAHCPPTPIRRAAARTFSPFSSTSVSSSPSSNVQPNAANLNPSVSQDTPPAAPVPPPRPTETPAQKVARLRAARLAEKAAEVSTWDRIVVTGRIWADRAHRITVFSIIIFSLVLIIITTYTLGDMIVYNRRKRKAWLQDQVREKEETIVAAIQNKKAGRPLTEDQELELNRERARFEAEERKKAKGGIIKRMTRPFTGFFAGMRSSESGEEETLGEGGGRGELVDMVGQRMHEAKEGMAEGLQTAEGEVVQGVRRAERGLKEAVAGNLGSGGKQAEQAALAAVHEAGREANRQSRGGPLDQMAENVAESGREKVENVKRGWFGGK